MDSDPVELDALHIAESGGTFLLTGRGEAGSVAIVRQRIVEALATGFYIGKIRFMPGTWGTLIGIPVTWLLIQGGPHFYMVASVLLLLASIAVAEFYEMYFHAHDPKEVVIDEIVGYIIAMTWLPATWQSFFAAFVLFRFFDILKPFPISYIDRKIPGGLGTVLDDVSAGLVTNILLQVVYSQTDWLGVKLHGL